ncbi:MAG: glycosyltransferase [Xenococcus sp. MO_188.B8]|nr:glycosyltransferase [Xenococcus sp. MO_188.B8]
MSFKPLFSIVIPTYNRPERLENCLSAIAKLDYRHDHFEVIVVDDGSQMSLNPITDKFTEHFSIHLIQQENAGPASARNTGAAAACGHYLVFTDDDCQPYSDWLQAVETAFNDFPDAMIGGRTVNALNDNSYSTASQLLIDYLYEYYNQARGNATFFASNNFAMPRQIFHKLEGFDTSFPLAAGEDREFCDRWLDNGFKMYYAPDMQINHFHGLTLSSFWRQHFNYGRGAYCFHQIHGERNQEGVKVEPLVFYFQLITYPFKQGSSPLGIWLACLLFLSQVANVVGFFWESLLGYGKYKASNNIA